MDQFSHITSLLEKSNLQLTVRNSWAHPPGGIGWQTGMFRKRGKQRGREIASSPKPTLREIRFLASFLTSPLFPSDVCKFVKVALSEQS